MNCKRQDPLEHPTGLFSFRGDQRVVYDPQRAVGFLARHKNAQKTLAGNDSRNTHAAACKRGGGFVLVCAVRQRAAHRRDDRELRAVAFFLRHAGDGAFLPRLADNAAFALLPS